MVATGGDFFEFQERGVTHTGCLPATSENEIGKIGTDFPLLTFALFDFGQVISILDKQGFPQLPKLGVFSSK